MEWMNKIVWNIIYFLGVIFFLFIIKIGDFSLLSIFS
jgi:hypothetical protein